MESFQIYKVSCLIFVFLSVSVEWVESTKLDSGSGLEYYTIGGTVLGIFLAIVIVSFIVLCWCCRIKKPKNELTQLKTPIPAPEDTRPKMAIIASMAPRRDFLKNEDDGLTYKKKPRLLKREESYV